MKRENERQIKKNLYRCAGGVPEAVVKVLQIRDCRTGRRKTKEMPVCMK